MKKISILSILMALVVMFTGCNPDMDTIALRAHLERGIANNNNGSKVYIDSLKFSAWNDGDVVKINENQYEVQVDEVNHDWAKITSVVYNASGYTAVYPADNAVCDRSSVMVSLSEGQLYVEGNDGQEIRNPMVARTDLGDGNLVFRNTGAVLGFDVKNQFANPIMVRHIVVKANGAGVLLSGDARITNIHTKTPTMEMMSGLNSTLLININKELANGATNEQSFYICIPPVTTEGNTFTVQVYFEDLVTDEAYIFEKTTNTSHGIIARNQLGRINVDLIPSSGDVEECLGLVGEGTITNPYLVGSDRDVRIISTNMSTLNDKSFKQVCDIVVPNEMNWTGFGTEENPFCGTYDGNGYSITANTTANESIYGGLFNHVGSGATIKDLTRKGNVTANEQVLYCGGVVGEVNGDNINISNCINMAGISIMNNHSYYNFIGGIVGCINSSSNVTMDRCLNKANIGLRWASGDNSLQRVGGLVGGIWASMNGITVTNCGNHGSIVGCYNVGGLFGMCGPVDIINSYSCGTISTCNHVGGVVAFIEGITPQDQFKMTNCYVTLNFERCGSHLMGITYMADPTYCVFDNVYIPREMNRYIGYDPQLPAGITIEARLNDIARHLDEWVCRHPGYVRWSYVDGLPMLDL